MSQIQFNHLKIEGKNFEILSLSYFENFIQC